MAPFAQLRARSRGGLALEPPVARLCEAGPLVQGVLQHLASSSAIAALRNLLAHWNSHNPVQKATKDSITNLVITAEAIICEEQVSWNSTAAKQETEKGAQNEEKDGEKKASGLRV